MSDLVPEHDPAGLARDARAWGAHLARRLRQVPATVRLVLVLGTIGVVGTVVEDSEVTSPTGALRDAPVRPSVNDDQPDDLPEDTTMVWSGFRLGDGYGQAVADDPRVPHSTVVRGEVLDLMESHTADGEVVDELPEDWSYPVEVLAFEPEPYDELLGRELLSGLEADEALLSATSAQVRGLQTGGVLVFDDDIELTVAGVVADELVGAAEIAVPIEGPLDVETEKYLLARPGGDDVHGTLAQLQTEQDREPRLVPHGTSPILRHAHSVLPAVARKAHFGEFPVQDLPGRDVRAGQSWIDEHITVASVPILGRVQCHRELTEPLRAAMQELVDRGATSAVDGHAGCWAPRTSGVDGPLSSHAWGMSIDLNAAANPYGAPPRQPEVLVEVMADHGFLWGGDWDVPDAMHFELAPGRDTSR